MAKRRPSPESLEQQRRQLDRCWAHECDIDPLILRSRLLISLGRRLQARGVQQEMQPMISL